METGTYQSHEEAQENTTDGGNVGDKVVNAEVQTTFVMKKNLRMRMSKIHTHTHTHIDRHKKALYFSIATVTIITTTSLTKGYKVTLYSDYLRETALYAI